MAPKMNKSSTRPWVLGECLVLVEWDDDFKLIHLTAISAKKKKLEVFSSTQARAYLKRSFLTPNLFLAEA